MKLRFRMLTIAVLAFSLTSTGCLFRSHKVQSNISHAPLQTASQTQLVDKLNATANAVQTMSATVAIATSVGGAKKGTVTEYSNITGYVLAQKPSMLRMIGQFPIVKNRAFDMVSNAQGFELWIPAKNRFVIGPSEVIKPSPNTLENLRPQIIMDAILFRAVQADEIAVLEARAQEVVEENSKEEKTTREGLPSRTISSMWSAKTRNQGSGIFRARSISTAPTCCPTASFSLTSEETSQPTHTTATSRISKAFHFPTHILIHRPEEEYTIGLTIIKLTLNKPFTPDQFQLAQPPGAQVVRLDGSQAKASSSATRFMETPR